MNATNLPAGRQGRKGVKVLKVHFRAAISWSYFVPKCLDGKKKSVKNRFKKFMFFCFET